MIHDLDRMLFCEVCGADACFGFNVTVEDIRMGYMGSWRCAEHHPDRKPSYSREEWAKARAEGRLYPNSPPGEWQGLGDLAAKITERLAPQIAQPMAVDTSNATPEEDADMSEMSERVARAIQQAESGVPWERVNQEWQSDYLKFARAAIEAMRNPTQAMIDAVDLSVPTEGMITDIWDTMIEAALK